MKVSIFGLGYVGCVTMGCLASLGHQVIGVDIDPAKVELVNRGKATIVEKDIDGLIEAGLAKGLIRATADPLQAVGQSEIALVCVATPNDNRGHLDMGAIERVAQNIALGIKDKEKFFTVAVRSTVMPGTNRRVIDIISSVTGKEHGVDFAVVSNPEFLREGSAVRDFMAPPYTVLASESDRGLEAVRHLYQGLDSSVIPVGIEVAELIKFVSNSFHALKVAFANEVGRLCKSLGADSLELMELFSKDTSLNISSAYLKPGFCYGGSCLPKDLRALNTIAHDHYMQLPILATIDASNRQHLEFIYNQVLNSGKKVVGVYGLAFKAGTDDLRLSPALELVERLLGKGIKVRVFDNHINISRLVGKNKAFLIERLPHVESLLTKDAASFTSGLEVLVIINPDEGLNQVRQLADEDLTVVDLSHAPGFKSLANYWGVCW